MSPLPHLPQNPGRRAHPQVSRFLGHTDPGFTLRSTYVGLVDEGVGDARTAVTIEPARAHDIAPLIADTYELTERERAITQLVARGLATRAIARRLHVSPWTVQDHLKSIFGKVGVSTRGELVARVFFGPDAPRLSEPSAL